MLSISYNASNSLILIRKSWHKLLLAIDPLLVRQIPQYLSCGFEGLFYSYNSFNQKGKAIAKMLLTKREDSYTSSLKEAAKSR
jgi:hypothetical protein